MDMIMNPAESGEYFSIGSLIRIEDCHKEKYEGTVRSFDYNSKILSIGILSKKNCNPLPNCCDDCVHYLGCLHFVAGLFTFKMTIDITCPRPYFGHIR